MRPLVWRITIGEVVLENHDSLSIIDELFIDYFIFIYRTLLYAKRSSKWMLWPLRILYQAGAKTANVIRKNFQLSA